LIRKTFANSMSAARFEFFRRSAEPFSTTCFARLHDAPHAQSEREPPFALPTKRTAVAVPQAKLIHRHAGRGTIFA